MVSDIPAPITVRRLLRLGTLSLRAFEHSLAAKVGDSSTGATLRKALSVPAFLLNLFYGVLSALTQGTAFATGLLVFFSTIELIGAYLLFNLEGDDRWKVVPFMLLAGVGLVAIRWCQQQAAENNTSLKRGLVAVLLLCGLAAYLQRSENLPHFVNLPQTIGRFSIEEVLWFGTLLFMVVLSELGRPLKTKKAPQGIVSFELAGSGERALAMLNSWNVQAHSKARWNLYLDFVFVLFYVALLWYFCQWAAHVPYARWMNNLDAPDKFSQILVSLLPGLGLVLSWSQLVAGLLDWCENIGLLQAMNAFESVKTEEAAEGQAHNNLLNATNDAQRIAAQTALNNHAIEKQKYLDSLDARAKFAAWCASWKFRLIIAGVLYCLGALWIFFGQKA